MVRMLDCGNAQAQRASISHEIMNRADDGFAALALLLRLCVGVHFSSPGSTAGL